MNITLDRDLYIKVMMALLRQEEVILTRSSEESDGKSTVQVTSSTFDTDGQSDSE